MKTLIQIVLVALIVGGMSAGGSVYWHLKLAKSAITIPAPDAEVASVEKKEKSVEKKEKSDEKKEKSEEEHGEDSHTADTLTHADDPGTITSDETVVAQVDTKHEQPEEIREPLQFGPPAGVRPPFDPNGDEGGELINKLRAKAIVTSQQERRMEEREEAMKLIIDDLRREQAYASKMRKRIADETNRTIQAVDEARRSTDAERAKMLEDQKQERQKNDETIRTLIREKEEAVQSTEAAMKAVRDEQEELRKQKEESEQATEPRDRSGSPEETTNLKDTVRRIDSMPAENTAKILQELVQKGRTAAVVAILNGMKPRQCASVLAVITEEEPGLAAELVDGMKRLKKETQSAPGTAK